MQVTFTAKCSYCARKFNASPQAFDACAPQCDDRAGRLCCDDCLCAECGDGHITEAEHLECEQEARFPDGPDFDTDLLYEQGRDALSGVR